MDTQQSRYIERYQESVLRGRDADEDELFLELEDELENDQFASSYREQRLQQLSKEFKEIQQSRVQIDSHYGNVKTLADEKEVIQETLDHKLTVIHFYKEDFQRCIIMDKKLLKLSVKHLSTNFLRVDVVKSPFLVHKLNVKVLPCVVCYINGVERDRIIGFERLGSVNGLDFSIEALRDLFYRIGIVNRKSDFHLNNSIRQKNNDDDDDEGSDLDL